MRKYKYESELKLIAELNSERICVRTMDGGNSHDEWRKATKKQREMLYGIFYGALLGLNWGEKMRATRDMEQAVIDTAEFQADILMRPLLRDGEELQGYMTVYIPLQKIVEEWERA
jgi:hypothetical protein